MTLRKSVGDFSVSVSDNPLAYGSGYAYYVVLVLSLVYTLSFADRMVMSLLIAPIKKDLGISDTMVSVLIGFAFVLFYVLMGLPFGYLSDRVNRRRMIRLGILAWSAMTAICGVATSFAALFAARMGVGVGEATLAPCAYSIIGDYFPRDRLAKAIAVYTLGAPLGTGLALVFGGFVVQTFTRSPILTLPIVGSIASWRVAFFGLALPGIIMATVMSSVREPTRSGALLTREDRPRAVDALRFVIRARRVLSYYLAGISLVSIVVYGSMAWIPTFFVRTHGMNVAKVGMYYGLILALGGTTGLLGGAWLGDRLVRGGAVDGHLRALLCGVVIAGPFFFAIPLVPNASLALILMIPATIAWSVSASLGVTIVQLMTPATLRGQMSAMYLFVASISGFGIGPTLVAVMTDFIFHSEYALRWSLAVVATLLPIAAILFARALKPFREACWTENTSNASMLASTRP